MLVRAARPLAGSAAIHLGLGALVVAAGSAGLTAPPAARVVWLALEPAEIPPSAVPAPPAIAARQRPVPAPVVAPRKPAPAPVLEEPEVPQTSSAAPSREVTAPEPPPAPSVASASPAPSVAASARAPEPDTASSGIAVASSGAPIDRGASHAPQERGAESPGRFAVASRAPDAAPSGPIVRAARPKGGYQVRPVYPESARRARIQGTTLLRIHIETDGRVSDVTVERSAGNQSLDQAAADAVRRWRFEPALSSAGPVAMSALVPVEFRIGERD